MKKQQDSHTASGSRAEIVETPLDVAVKDLRPVLLWGTFIGLITTVLSFVGPLFMINVFERVLQSRNETTLVVLLAIMIFALLVQSYLEANRANLLRRAAVQFDRKIANEAFDAIQRAIVKRPMDRSIATLRDTETVRDFVAGPTLSGLMDAVWFPVFIIVTYIIHPLFAVVALVTGALIGGLTLLTTKVTTEPLKEASKADLMAMQRANAAFQNYEAVHSMGMRVPMRRLWSGLHEAALGWSVVADDRSTTARTLSSFVRQASSNATIALAAFLVLHRELNPGQIFAASIVVGMATAPLQRVITQWKSIGQAREARDRLQALFIAAASTGTKMKLPKPSGALSLESVAVVPPGKGIESIILRNVSFEVPAGSVLALIGPSGCGKSSLLRVLLNVWKPFAGEVRIDGTAVEDWDEDDLSGWIGYLPQSVELFPGTIEQNIARFTEASHEEVIAAAELAGVHDLIQKLPQGYNTEIGEFGSMLAGGQRQRIGLARAVFGDPSLVILDEPNSNLDAVGEERLTQAIARLREAGKTVVFVTHKVSLVSVADYVAVLGNGTLSNFGSKAEVMQRIAQPRVIVNRVGATGS